LTAGATYKVRLVSESNTLGEYFLGVQPLREPTITVYRDDGQWGMSVSGPGWALQTGGFQNDYRLLPAGRGAATTKASWVMPPSSGTAEVFVTWVPRPTNATNATYKIYDGSTLRGTVVLDQTRAPNSVLAFGTTLAQSLGTYLFTTSVLRVDLLTLGANGDLVADAALDPPVGDVVRLDFVTTTDSDTIHPTPLQDRDLLWTHGNHSLFQEFGVPALAFGQTPAVPADVSTSTADHEASVTHQGSPSVDWVSLLVSSRKGRRASQAADDFFASRE
jgi:hypothetical protein